MSWGVLGCPGVLRLTANIYSRSKGDNALFIHAKSSSQMLNTFEKNKNKKRNVIFYKDNN